MFTFILDILLTEILLLDLADGLEFYWTSPSPWDKKQILYYPQNLSSTYLLHFLRLFSDFLINIEASKISCGYEFWHS